MTKKKIIISISILLSIIIAIGTIYSIYIFSNTISLSQLQTYVEKNSQRESKDFLVVTDNQIGEEYVFYVSKTIDNDKTKSQEMCCFSRFKTFIPFVKRYKKVLNTSGNQTYRPADGLLFTPKGGNFEIGAERNIILYSANDDKISRIEYVTTTNGTQTLSRRAVSKK